MTKKSAENEAVVCVDSAVGRRVTGWRCDRLAGAGGPLSTCRSEHGTTAEHHVRSEMDGQQRVIVTVTLCAMVCSVSELCCGREADWLQANLICQIFAAAKGKSKMNQIINYQNANRGREVLFGVENANTDAATLH